MNEIIDRIIENLRELIKRKSENPCAVLSCTNREIPVEREVSDFIENYLDNLGLKVRRVGSKIRYNLDVTIGKAKNTIIFNGHMDTVPIGDVKKWDLDPFTGIIRDGKLYGRGAADMKGTLAIYLTLIEDLIKIEDELNVKVKFHFVVDEESGANSPLGTRLLVKKRLGDFVIIGEPGSDKIANGHRGLYRFKIITHGEAIHTGIGAWEIKKKGRNAIIDMMKIIEEINNLSNELLEVSGPYERRDVITFPTMIRGGTAINTVPDLCEAFGDCRLISMELDEIKKLIIEKLPKDINYEIIDLVKVPPIIVNPKNRYIQIFRKVSREILGKDLPVKPAGPTSDLWFYVKNGIPGIQFGPYGGNIHAPNEWVSIKSLEEVYKIYKEFLLHI